MSPSGDLPMLTGKTLIEASGFDLALPASAVLVFDESLVPRSRLRPLKSPDPRPFRALSLADEHVAVVAATGPGAPVAAITVELLAAMGVRRLISVGTAGRLHASDNAPQLWLAERAVSDEGTSAHYGAARTPDPTLMRALDAETSAPACVTLTTDVPFRHTTQRLARHRDDADLVEMEVAAIYAAARHLGVAAASMLVTSDEFGTTSWAPLAGPEIKARLDAALSTAIQVLGRP